jgi:CRP-like cAMP-binding protein
MARDRIWFALARHGIEIPVATQAIRLTQLPAMREELPDAAVQRRAESLERVAILDALSPQQIGTLAAESADRVYAAGEPVIREGEAGESMFIVIEGRVEVTVREGDGPPVTLRTLGAGDYFGEMSLMTGARRRATVTAIEETRVLELQKGSFKRVLDARPELVGQLGAALQSRLAERTQAIAGAERNVPEEQDIFQTIREFFAM